MEALDLASKSEKVILFLGLNPGTESEGFDRTDMQIPVEQRRLFDELHAVNPNIIVVLNCGQIRFGDVCRGCNLIHCLFSVPIVHDPRILKALAARQFYDLHGITFLKQF